MLNIALQCYKKAFPHNKGGRVGMRVVYDYYINGANSFNIKRYALRQGESFL